MLQLQGLVMAARKRLGFRTRIRNPGIDEHQQNGNAENSIDVIRNLANVLLSQARTKLGIAVPVSHPLFAWAWVQASWLYNRFHVKAGLTAHERASGCRYNGRLLPLAEPCWAYVRPSQKGSPRWTMSVFLTKRCLLPLLEACSSPGRSAERASHGPPRELLQRPSRVCHGITTSESSAQR